MPRHLFVKFDFLTLQSVDTSLVSVTGMPPVTGGVTDAEKNGLVFSFYFGKSFLAPGVPIHGVIGML